MQKKSSGVCVKRGYSAARDEVEAVKELAAAVEQPDIRMVLFFASSNYDLEKLGASLAGSFNSLLIGCTTSGEITPEGYSTNSISGVSIAGSDLEVHPFLIAPIREFDAAVMERVVDSLKDLLTQKLRVRPEAAAFGLLFIDGLSLMEEQVIAILSDAVSGVPIIGGSAGDDLKLDQTHVYFDGKFIPDAALFALCITSLPFSTIRAQHFTATDKRLVITKATPEKRLVHEINGRPAVEEYARVIGMDVMELRHLIYFATPVMLRVGGEYYIRSIQRVNEDGSLTFFSAIDEGLVLRVAERGDFVVNLEEAFRMVRAKIPNIALTIGCDCILRRLEVMDKQMEQEVNEVFVQNKVIGFNTYGEQFNSVHVNQTFTGIVLGE